MIFIEFVFLINKIYHIDKFYLVYILPKQFIRFD